MDTKKIEIFHVKEECCELMFMNAQWWEKKNKPITDENYEKVYTCEVPSNMSLEDIFSKFNVDRPADYRAHSMSVSDVVVVYDADGKSTAYFCDSWGFKTIPNFFNTAAERS